ncbi:MAG: hydroxymethylbilane synthase [Candidatus Omnitrophota bacterium]|nr:hydroxymethylbilane synthase [Candidatus Omnitrophota bacterium]
MKNNCIIIGSRGSKLALAQAELVKNNLKNNYSFLTIEVKVIKTTGDKILDVPLAKIGDKGLFTKELEEALLRSEIDLAVHSMKDLPTDIPKALEIGAITAREEACDVLVSRESFTIKALPNNVKVGTSSLRRRAQLLSLRPDIQALDLRGNLDTRLAKLDSGLYGAIILAYAGIKRLGLNPVRDNLSTLYIDTKLILGSDSVSEGLSVIDGRLRRPISNGVNLSMTRISFDEMLPQAGQGALGIETRKGDFDVLNLIKTLDDSDSRLCIEAERALLSGLGGGCQVPIGVYAKIEGGDVNIKAGVFSLDGKTVIKDEIRGKKNEAVVLGKQLADLLLKKGAKNILEEVYHA